VEGNCPKAVFCISSGSGNVCRVVVGDRMAVSLDLLPALPFAWRFSSKSEAPGTRMIGLYVPPRGSATPASRTCSGATA
jgi:hypothetical protein